MVMLLPLRLSPALGCDYELVRRNGLACPSFYKIGCQLKAFAEVALAAPVFSSRFRCRRHVSTDERVVLGSYAHDASNGIWEIRFC